MELHFVAHFRHVHIAGLRMLQKASGFLYKVVGCEVLLLLSCATLAWDLLATGNIWPHDIALLSVYGLAAVATFNGGNKHTGRYVPYVCLICMSHYVSGCVCPELSILLLPINPQPASPAASQATTQAASQATTQAASQPA